MEFKNAILIEIGVKSPKCKKALKRNRNRAFAQHNSRTLNDFLAGYFKGILFNISLAAQ
jgi:hypothetical protein